MKVTCPCAAAHRGKSLNTQVDLPDSRGDTTATLDDFAGVGCIHVRAIRQSSRCRSLKLITPPVSSAFNARGQYTNANSRGSALVRAIRPAGLSSNLISGI